MSISKEKLTKALVDGGQRFRGHAMKLDTLPKAVRESVKAAAEQGATATGVARILTDKGYPCSEHCVRRWLDRIGVRRIGGGSL